ncbi:antA/AntB antirepressor family protein [Actinobacillus sp. GY-402]|nr:antA/AntB antirepressor family protein [Actinobacillus sp. GY-402]
MTTFPIKTFTGSIFNQSVQLVNARELHQILQSKQDFSNWIKHRISEYEFAESVDFIGVDKIIVTEAGFLGKREKVIKDYHLTIDMVKELCMIERTKIGREVRRYFIRMEKEALAARQALPAPTTQANAISVSKDRYIELLENENRMLRSRPNPLRKKAPVPLSAVEKDQILQLSHQGVQTTAIAKQINRSRSAVRAVIRENLGE